MARRKAQASRTSQDVEALAQTTSQDGEDGDLPGFFNTTFSTHRASPLYVGSEGLGTIRLNRLARSLRDTLVGDVVRGIQVGLEATDTPMGQVGPLRSVQIRWFQTSSVFGVASSAEEANRDSHAEEPTKNSTSTSNTHWRGLWIEIRHENAAYMGILLPGLSETSGAHVNSAQDWTMQPEGGHKSVDNHPDHFINLPLLLLRMPLPLKNIVSEWLSTTFDCRVSKVTLGTKTIVNIWEAWVQATGLPARGPDFVVTLAFNAPLSESDQRDIDAELDPIGKQAEPGLRSVDITISPEDLRRFVQAGTTLRPQNRQNSGSWVADVRERRKLAGGNSEDGWSWRDDKDGQDPPKFPFTEALGRYLDHHLALNLFHPSVRVTQISCAGFVLGQSRLKILSLGEVSPELGKATWMFITRLGDRVQSQELPRFFTTKDG